MKNKVGNPNWLAGNSGNPKGRPKGSKDIFSLERFAEVLREVEYTKRKSLFQHAIEQAYVDNRVLMMLLNKILPSVQPESDDSEKWINEEIEITPKIEDIERFKQYMN